MRLPPALLALVLVACDKEAVGKVGRVMVDAGTLVGDAIVEAGSFLRDSGSSDASAQVPPHGSLQGGVQCQQWEISTWKFEDGGCRPPAPSAADGESCAIPAGWEPFSVATPGNITHFYLRRCKS